MDKACSWLDGNLILWFNSETVNFLKAPNDVTWLRDILSSLWTVGYGGDVVAIFTVGSVEIRGGGGLDFVCSRLESHQYEVNTLNWEPVLY